MSHDVYMQRCVELARNGLGSAAPNPMVGAVIVHDGKIIGEGYHERFGEAHAEVNAINSVADQALLEQSTIYVSLEPCCHQGKTPPCADLIIEKRIPRVVIGTRDPFPKVSGGGVKRLKDAGVEVIEGVKEELCNDLNKRFFTAQVKDRPYIILKWAQSSDGFMAPKQQKAGEITWITGKTSKVLTHKWRSEEQAILVGSNTIKKDNPELTTREYEGASPTRVILDPDLETSTESRVMKDDAPTLIYNIETERTADHVSFIKVEENGYLPEVLSDLVERGIHSMIVEGGPQTLRGFISSNLWDEGRIFTGPIVLNEGIMAPVIDGELRDVVKIDNDLLQFYINHRS